MHSFLKPNNKYYNHDHHHCRPRHHHHRHHHYHHRQCQTYVGGTDPSSQLPQVLESSAFIGVSAGVSDPPLQNGHTILRVGGLYASSFLQLLPVSSSPYSFGNATTNAHAKFFAPVSVSFGGLIIAKLRAKMTAASLIVLAQVGRFVVFERWHVVAKTRCHVDNIIERLILPAPSGFSYIMAQTALRLLGAEDVQLQTPLQSVKQYGKLVRPKKACRFLNDVL